MRRYLLLIIVPLVPALLTGWLHPHRPDWASALHPIPQVSLAFIPPGALWIDAREPRDYATAHVPGALSLSETNWEQSLPAFVDAWSPSIPVVVYCGGEACGASRAVARRIRHELGIQKVVILEGGWTAWRAAHNP